MKLGWIDFSPEDRKRAIEALNALNERTEDELGTGVIRDAFASAFFPGTSTLHTRAKYFILIPCAIRMMLEQFSPAKKPRRILEELRKVELGCARRMRDYCINNCINVESQGIIGQQELNKAGWIVRAPSEIYWAGLRTFGISSISSSVTKWLEYVEGQLAPETGSRAKHSRREEEDGVTDDADTQLADWKADIIIDEDIFQDFKNAYEAEALQPELTQREADFLHEQICRSTSGSLLEFYLTTGCKPPNPNRRSDDTATNEEQTSFYQFAQSLHDNDSVSSEMKTLLAAACAFNRFNFAANVLYNKMLGIPEAKTTWDAIRHSVPDLRLDLSSVSELSKSSRISSAVEFLNDLQEAFQGKNIEKAENRIMERERLCSKRKEKKAKLDRQGHSEDWVGVKWHDFRLANAARILNDITHPAEDAHEHV